MSIGPLATNLSEILIEVQTFLTRKCIRKYRQQSGSYFVQGRWVKPRMNPHENQSKTDYFPLKTKQPLGPNRLPIKSPFAHICVIMPETIEYFNTLRPRQDSCPFPDDIFKSIFFNENVYILLKISLTFVPKAPSNNIPALVQIMAWCRPGDKPLSEPMMVSLVPHIWVIRPQWVNTVVCVCVTCIHICTKIYRPCKMEPDSNTSKFSAIKHISYLSTHKPTVCKVA